MRRFPVTRRDLFRLALSLLAATPTALRAGPRPKDNGIGGTGAVSAMPEADPGERDNGIGGTGVVGTIRDFGSIVVNDIHVAYADDVAVTIDGAPVVASQMRIGHVVSLVAERDAGRYTTRRIAILHEVVGRIETVSGRRIRILGQNVELRRSAGAGRLAVGQHVAVSGLRLPDQTIVASLVEPATPQSAQLVGVVTRAPNGLLAIGAQPLAGVAEAKLGTRIAVRGALSGDAHDSGQSGIFHAVSVSDDAWLPFGPSRFLVETYVESRGGGVTTANGLNLGPAPSKTPQGVSRAIMRLGGDAAHPFAIQSFRPVEALGARGSAKDAVLPQPAAPRAPSDERSGAFPGFDAPTSAPGFGGGAPGDGFGGPPRAPFGPGGPPGFGPPGGPFGGGGPRR